MATGSTPPVVLSRLRFHGLDKDVIGIAPGSPPDGRPDGHFSIELTTPNGLLDLAAACPRPTRTGGSTTATGSLAVFRGGARLTLQASHPETCPPRCDLDLENWIDMHWSTTPTRLDLYATDEAWGPFKPGQRWKVITTGQLPRGSG